MAAPYISFLRLQGTFRLLMPEKPALAISPKVRRNTVRSPAEFRAPDTVNGLPDLP